MKDIIKIIGELKELSGKKQIECLKKYADNNTLKEILFYTYNPNMKYNINEAKLDKAVQKFEFNNQVLNFSSNINSFINDDGQSWIFFKEFLDALSQSKGVKESEIDKIVEMFWGSLDEDTVRLFKCILLKDLRIGMNVSSFNKVWDDFYVVPEVMLAKLFSGNAPDISFVSRKFDGQRMFYLDGKFYSRTYKEINTEPIKLITEQLSNIPNNYVLDGELIYFSDSDYKEDFQKTIALSSKEIWQDGCEKLYYVCFDILDKDKFLTKKCSKKFTETYVELCNVLHADVSDPSSNVNCLFGTAHENIKIAKQFDITKLSILQNLVDSKGWEGLMIRDADKPYESKRTSALQKIKKMEDSEFEIIGFEEGSGKYEDTLGSIIIRLETGETVNVGSGFSDSDRSYIWQNKDDILESKKMLKVKYFEKTKDKHGNNSLRFPIFLCFRNSSGEES